MPQFLLFSELVSGNHRLYWSFNIIDAVEELIRFANVWEPALQTSTWSMRKVTVPLMPCLDKLLDFRWGGACLAYSHTGKQTIAKHI